MKKIQTITDSYPNHLLIYTDGSKDGIKVGCTTIHNKTKLMKQLLNHSSIISAEVALDVISASKHKKILIYSNSMSVLTALKNNKIK